MPPALVGVVRLIRKGGRRPALDLAQCRPHRLVFLCHGRRPFEGSLYPLGSKKFRPQCGPLFRFVVPLPSKKERDENYGHYLILNHAIRRESEYVEWLRESMK